MKKKNQDDWDKVYSSKKNLKKLPWLRTVIPEWFLKIVNNPRWVEPCLALDLGCGNGYYAYFLSNKGFKVTGVDVSKKIIAVAKKTYTNNNLEFKELDVFSSHLLTNNYDFTYDIGLFHNILPERRKEYVDVIASKLNKKGKFLLFCFDKREKTFNNKPIYLNTLYDMYSYPLSKEEIIKTFSSKFKIEKIIEHRYGTNNYKRRFICLMSKK
ncbi:MAG: class I SAM-dependent methyltransferase [archaeon]|jgi:cyclopropane fatty-acyl-phospholipid synthase-like methyltransferase|nr:class I SAM-dependent methyltransferase [archaeon]MDD2477648.1 class I SAM-dependent methyltransferase [Candidatus ainarchaeum sp.]MDD3084374.1 class I SAM-dependent methyltransferase [Candidatus ainarchaeum sp.]MDD4220830.1 class I SAM-dependent methyltransferase [Candidatus ainarchaeum sp.]MDD4662330.1 class I SAM-dependent methyltransferase [Candidatus ainarchaeum sp.]